MDEDNYKLWYEEAIIASNELGFAGMSAADVIKYQAIEIEQWKKDLRETEEELYRMKSYFSHNA